MVFLEVIFLDFWEMVIVREFVPWKLKTQSCCFQSQSRHITKLLIQLTLVFSNTKYLKLCFFFRTIFRVPWSFSNWPKQKTLGISNLNTSNFCWKKCRTKLLVPWEVFSCHLELFSKFPKFWNVSLPTAVEKWKVLKD